MLGRFSTALQNAVDVVRQFISYICVCFAFSAVEVHNVEK